MIRSVVIVGLVLSLGSLFVARSAAAADPVVQVVTVKVNPGMLEKYQGELKKIRGVQTRLESKASMRVWNATAAGEDTGQVLVGLEYPDMAAWAADSAKMQADAEWQKIQNGLSSIRTVVSSSIWRDISPVKGAASAGGTLVLTAAAVKPGKLEDYKKRVASLNAIQTRLKIPTRVRMWQGELAGDAAGSVAIGAEYADASSYVAAQEKLTADPEWQKLLAGLDDVRTVAGRSMYQEITQQP